MVGEVSWTLGNDEDGWNKAGQLSVELQHPTLPKVGLFARDVLNGA